jgi:hypothetical protein
MIDVLSSCKSLWTAARTATTRHHVTVPCATHALHPGTAPSCLYSALTFGPLVFYYIPLFFLAPLFIFIFLFYFAFYFSFVISFSLLFPLARSVCVCEYRPAFLCVYARTYVCMYVRVPDFQALPTLSTDVQVFMVLPVGVCQSTRCNSACIFTRDASCCPSHQTQYPDECSVLTALMKLKRQSKGGITQSAPEHGSYHGMYGRIQAFYAIKLPSSVTRYEGQSVYGLLHSHVLLRTFPNVCFCLSDTLDSCQQRVYCVLRR